MPENRHVLLIGFDPHAVPGVDAAAVDAAIAIGQKRFDESGITAEQCLIKPDASAEAQIAEHLKRRDYACVVIGGGLRKPDQAVELLERTIHLVRQHAPGAAIAFNTNPTTSFDAAMRWLS
jgi:molybdopterin biosynthesis enzyme MoaB